MNFRDSLHRSATFLRQRKKTTVALLVLFALWCLRDPLLTFAVKQQLHKVPEVDIRFAALKVSLVPGSLTLSNIEIDKSPVPDAGGLAAKPLPLARVDELVVRWRYGALFDQTVAGSAELTGVTASLWRVETRRLKKKQDGSKRSPQEPKERVVQAEILPEPPAPETISAAWPEIARLALPISVDSVEVRDAKLVWHDTTTKPQVDAEVAGIALSANNLTNREKLTDGQYGRAVVHAEPAGGTFDMTMELDPLARSPTFAMRGDLKGLQLPEVNQVLQAYAKLDTEAGALAAKLAFKCERGRYVGNIEPSLKGLKIRKESEDQEANTWLNRLYRRTAQAVGSLLKDNESDTIASRIPLAGEFADPEIGVGAAIGSLLSNAFLQALIPGEQGSWQGRLQPKKIVPASAATSKQSAKASSGQRAKKKVKSKR